MTNREFRNEIAAEIRMYRRWRKTNPDLRFAAITAVNTLKTFAERVPADSFYDQAPVMQWADAADSFLYNADNPLASRDLCRLAREG